MDYNVKSLAVHSMLFPSLNSNLDGISIDLFLYGCKRRCMGCHNLELQEFRHFTHSINEILVSIQKAYSYKVSPVLTILGGEPLDSDLNTLLSFINRTKQVFPKIKVSLFTGYKFSQVPDEILEVLDYIKTGEYDKLKPSDFGSFLASTNQKMFKKDNMGKFLQQYPKI